MDKKYVLMAIKPQYANLIKSGEKKAELRRVAPHVNPGDILVIYESAPISKVTSYAEIAALIQMPPCTLWESVGADAKIDKGNFDSYFYNKEVGSALKLINIKVLTEARSLNAVSGLRAPQNYRYMSEMDFNLLCGKK